VLLFEYYFLHLKNVRCDDFVTYIPTGTIEMHVS
jgi:hypothetical protein